MTIEDIRRAATAAGNKWMAEHPDEKPKGDAAWTVDAWVAANLEMHRLARLHNVYLYQLPKGSPRRVWKPNF
jgi:hypothetical protein